MSSRRAPASSAFISAREGSKSVKSRAVVMLCSSMGALLVLSAALPAFAICPAPVVRARPTSVAPGDQIVVSGQGFFGESCKAPASGRARVTVDLVQGTKSLALGSAPVKRDGSFRFVGRVPTTLDPGDAFVRVSDKTGFESQLNVRIGSAASPTPTPSPSDEAPGQGSLVYVIGALVTAVIVVLLLFGLKRRARRPQDTPRYRGS